MKKKSIKKVLVLAYLFLGVVLVPFALSKMAVGVLSLTPPVTPSIRIVRPTGPLPVMKPTPRLPMKRSRPRPLSK
ncbi:MAG: hypothetical protein ABID04_02415 [Patescibacteria group bacterium]